MDLNERLNSILDKGPDKWLSRALSEKNVSYNYKGAKGGTDREDFEAQAAAETDTDVERISHAMMSGVLRKKRGLKPNVGQELQRAVDDVVSPLPRQAGRAKQRAKNLGIKVGKVDGQDAVMEPQFDIDTEEDRGRGASPKRPNLNLDLDLNRIKSRQDIRRHELDNLSQASRAEENAEAVGLESHVEHAINSGGLGQGGRRTRPDAPGGSVWKYRDENATLDAIHAIANSGVRADSDELSELLHQHFMMNDQGRAIPTRERNRKVEAAIKAAQAIINDFGADGKAINLGRFGGQQTAIPDENRNNFYDEIIEKLFHSVGRRDGGETGTSQAARNRASTSGRRIVQELLFGDAEGSTANLKDLLQNADIYLTDPAQEEELRGNFNEIVNSYENDTENAVQTGDYLRQIQEMLGSAMDNSAMTGYSLKEIQQGAPVTMKTLNQNPESYIKLVNAAIRGDIKFPHQWNSDTGSLRARRNFNFDLLMDQIDVLDGVEGEPKDMESKYASSTNTKPSKFKVEPFGFGARMGETPKPIVTQLLQQYADGEGIDDMIPETAGTRESHVLRTPNFTDEQIQYWQDYAQDLYDNPSDKFNMAATPFDVDGEEMSPRDFIGMTLRNFGLTDEERAAGSAVVDRNGKPYHTVDSRFDTLGLIRNMRMWKALRNADRTGNFDDIIRTIVGGAGKMNTEPAGNFWPKKQVGSGDKE